MIRIYIVSIIAVFFLSCEKEIDFKYNIVEDQLVIEGKISESGSTVILTHTTPMSEKMNTTPITDAMVMIKDQTDNDSVVLDVNNTGYYTNPLSGIVGHDYELTVIRDDKTYKSVSTMKGATKIINLEFQWIKMPYDYVAVLNVTFLSLEREDCYWIRIYRDNSPYLWLLSDGRSSVNGIINEVVMTSRKDTDNESDNYVLKEGNVIKVVISPISKVMYDYLTSIQNDSNGPQMFAGDFCLGYFIATEDSERSIVFKPDEISEVK